ncbi:mycothiol transferase [Allobranchiibius huperziae]|uniref:Putative damage-inducible protein DinB n=1 Tax=Allobranchiibius huperziae TaxID=1874116 RepID=A0A853DFX9_9MICO|nr:DinB family protein [Allobranchiibius huperziae]NYJ76422.1 putative damage-inducible protein DinB [Allobranchiibius huperziae]
MSSDSAAALAGSLLTDAFGRVHELLPGIVHDLSTAELTWRPDRDANSVGWLVWHLTRVQDDHIAGLTGDDQVWTADGWVSRFALPYDDDTLGYGQSSAEVGEFAVDDPALLTGYHEATHRATIAALRGFSAADYDRVVDEHWDPPVTLGARVVSVLNDITQHAGQAAYVRGLLERRT